MKPIVALNLALASISLVACQSITDPAPMVNSIMPAHAAGGATITIHGSGFSTTASNNVVKINGTMAMVLNATFTSLTVTVPIKAGTGRVNVAVKDGLTGKGPTFRYDWRPKAAVSLSLTDSTTGAIFKFGKAFGMALDARGNLFIADENKNQILRVTASGNVSVFAGSGTPGTKDGAGTAAQFYSPNGLVFDAAGNLYVAEYSNNMIRKIDTAGKVITIAGNGTPGKANGKGKSATFDGPVGLTISASGYLFVTAENGDGLIRKISCSSHQVSTLAGKRTATKLFTNPYGICTDSKGIIYVSDWGNNNIFKITPDGVITTFAGSGTFGNVDGTGKTAQFSSPLGICSDPDGNLFVADRYNSVVRKITPSAAVSTFAGTGATSTTGATITLNRPHGIIYDARTHSLYISDNNGTGITKISLQ